MATTIYRIKINWILPGVDTKTGAAKLIHRQALTFRLAAQNQTQAEHIGRAVWTTWMRENPGDASEMILDWPRPDELGETAYDGS